MSGNGVWLATLATVVLLFGYETVVAVAQRRRPDRSAIVVAALSGFDRFRAG